MGGCRTMVKRDLLNLSELIDGACNQLRYVTRFSTTRTLLKESVAEHSFFTAFFSLLIGYALKEKGIPIKFECLLEKALLHDMEEQFTGDIIRPIKHSSESFKASIEGISEKF